MSMVEEIVLGQRFGLLTVLSKADGKYYLCQCVCGMTKKVRRDHLKTGKTISCGVCGRKDQPKGDLAFNWKGGRRIEDGYALVYCPHHANRKSNGYVREHTLVMSEHLGRPLVKGETVHHKNGVRDDNRIENLELWSKSQPPGQRVQDKVAWAREILSLYEGCDLTDPSLAL